jgi:adenosylmethionine-8-amino-7-oxononanoate aminotransferase
MVTAIPLIADDAIYKQLTTLEHVLLEDLQQPAIVLGEKLIDFT